MVPLVFLEQQGFGVMRPFVSIPYWNFKRWVWDNCKVITGNLANKKRKTGAYVNECLEWSL